MDVRGVERGASSAATGSCRGRARGIAVAQRRCRRARVCGRRRPSASDSAASRRQDLQGSETEEHGIAADHRRGDRAAGSADDTVAQQTAITYALEVLKTMGFGRAASAAALVKAKGDVARAVEALTRDQSQNVVPRVPVSRPAGDTPSPPASSSTPATKSARGDDSSTLTLTGRAAGLQADATFPSELDVQRFQPPRNGHRWAPEERAAWQQTMLASLLGRGPASVVDANEQLAHELASVDNRLAQPESRRADVSLPPPASSVPEPAPETTSTPPPPPGTTSTLPPPPPGTTSTQSGDSSNRTSTVTEPTTEESPPTLRVLVLKAPWAMLVVRGAGVLVTFKPLEGSLPCKVVVADCGLKDSTNRAFGPCQALLSRVHCRAADLRRLIAGEPTKGLVGAATLLRRLDRAPDCLAPRLRAAGGTPTCASPRIPTVTDFHDRPEIPRPSQDCGAGRRRGGRALVVLRHGVRVFGVFGKCCGVRGRLRESRKLERRARTSDALQQEARPRRWRRRRQRRQRRRLARCLKNTPFNPRLPRQRRHRRPAQLCR
mmetsp:Transcript_10370/g.31281  ORF Transcript_10370/g.31281 Transcript_10370/m.31281 type:complete len:549 (+) Transcript_10370:871-2517(+)